MSKTKSKSEKAKSLKVRIRADHFEVESQSHKGKWYQVTIENGSYACDCFDFRRNRSECKHTIAVELNKPQLGQPASAKCFLCGRSLIDSAGTICTNCAMDEKAFEKYSRKFQTIVKRELYR